MIRKIYDNNSKVYNNGNDDISDTKNNEKKHNGNHDKGRGNDNEDEDINDYENNYKIYGTTDNNDNRILTRIIIVVWISSLSIIMILMIGSNIDKDNDKNEDGANNIYENDNDHTIIIQLMLILMLKIITLMKTIKI